MHNFIPLLEGEAVQEDLAPKVNSMIAVVDMNVLNNATLL